ncbi:SpoIID/LytB domain-containing protein [Desulfotomaculum copahuensis]|uniref:Stage II sporulation protein SpoIID n=1 Tax=Desulfotomaculum copahuensis TaxID=1838280 RepID=A0A1B7LCP1_9FIRM|nr:SpoIID/LytB domain-containing protein [Desulfotomaculum copahuensis]OAT80679.1 stage II sporulation protein SpoIID [Desulfotomaculum copahuensis]
MQVKHFTGVIILISVLGLIASGCSRAAPRKPVPAGPGREPAISLYINETGQKKTLKLEDYVAGVVAAEMEPSWPVNALAAQAILARTFTMENIKAGRVKRLHGTDASTSVEEFQAYNPARINDNVRQAVARTRGEVVTHRGDYIKSWFSACDGGVSASAAEGLAYTKKPTPYVKAGVKDNCLSITTPENRHWVHKFPLAAVRAAVQQVTGRDPGAITGAVVVRRGPSGRAEQLRIGGVTVGAPALRLALGSDLMRSTLLTGVSVDADSLILTGKGYGHGVGMCQWGARLMAQQGRSPQEIIRFYYQNIKLQKLWT